MTYKPISEYGVIGDMHSAALVGTDGSIDWLCFPRFDSPSVFAAILDDRAGGRFRIAPRGEYEASQNYLQDNNVLVTRFATPSGVVTLTDFMPVSPGLIEGRHEVTRILRCESGSVEMEALFQPRLDYARGRTEITVGEHLALARKGDDRLSLASDVRLEAAEGSAVARFSLHSNDAATFVLHWQKEAPPDVREYGAAEQQGGTEAFWKFVSRDWRYTGHWEAVVKRSMLALHLLLYAPTGAVCAAVTTSLPERIGGVRNWDYRFSWLRDAAFTMDVFHRLGHTAYTRPFIEWMAQQAICDGQDSQVKAFYNIAQTPNGHVMEERTLDHLEGYRGSAPVRIGNAAHEQLQLDIFGEVLLSFDSYHRAGGVIDEPLWDLAECLVEMALRRWRQPDLGIWEFRTEPRHFTFSKLMCWVAVDRGLRLAHALKKPVDFGRWSAGRNEIRQDILDRGWDESRGAFVQYYGGTSLDASLLFIPMVGFLSAQDPRMNASIDAIWRELGADGLLHRYIPDQARDGLPGDEGTFTMCSLWLAGSLVAAGRIEEAEGVFKHVLKLGNRLGLYSEMLDPATGAYLGNYPQAFTHIALIHTARNLDRALRRLEVGKVVAA